MRGAAATRGPGRGVGGGMQDEAGERTDVARAAGQGGRCFGGGDEAAQAAGPGLRVTSGVQRPDGGGRLWTKALSVKGRARHRSFEHSWYDSEKLGGPCQICATSALGLEPPCAIYETRSCTLGLDNPGKQTYLVRGAQSNWLESPRLHTPVAVPAAARPSRLARGVFF
jgi:hypothetical protein